uniref:Proline-serine-threonine phosphatase interacting protein 2 n=1 Tax=Cyprinus carpio TaxID=7962 RepID=A0A8C2DGL7_CYPCA
MRELHFKDNFWNTEIISTVGYDSIIQHLNDGKRTCKEIEDFMKARAAIEEKYAKELLGLSKKWMFVCLFFKAKKTYEQKCRDKEEAEQNMNRNATTSSSKQQEKLYAKTQQAKQTAEEADRIYSHNVSLLGKLREEWLNEHVKACEFFEKQEVERISTLRNVVWTHLNHLSQQCVTSDELYEEVRKSLEQCNIQEDIEHFINLRRTGDKPPGTLTTTRSPVTSSHFKSMQLILYEGEQFTNVNTHLLCILLSEPGYSLIRY